MSWAWDKRSEPIETGDAIPSEAYCCQTKPHGRPCSDKNDGKLEVVHRFFLQPVRKSQMASGRLTALEFSGASRADARMASAATKG